MYVNVTCTCISCRAWICGNLSENTAAAYYWYADYRYIVETAQSGSMQLLDLMNIPVSIVLGIALGALVGFALAWFFETSYSHQNLVRNSMKVIIVLGTAFLLLAIEDWLEGIIAVSGLLAIMSMAMVLAMRSVPEVTGRLQAKYGKLWLAAEVILFVLVGAAVDIRYTLKAGPGAVWMILIGLVFRCAGVWLCMMGTKLNQKERLYCMIAYLPKATVQAAIGSVPLAMGLSCGNIVLSVAVLSILIKVPLGAVGMDLSYKKLLRVTVHTALSREVFSCCKHENPETYSAK